MSYPIRMVPAQGAEADYEQLGTKSKFWLTGAEWGTTGSLFKYSRLNTGEHWSEKCAAEICAVMGIEHVAYDLGKLFKNPCSQAELNKIVPFGFSLQRQKNGVFLPLK